MYKEYLKIIDTKNKGKGVISLIKIPANSPIVEVMGDLTSEEDTPDINHPAMLQVGHDKFLGPSGEVDDYINHSCDPNCYLHIVGNRAIVYSLYEIAPNMELTFDYSTSSTDDIEKWSMNCNCGSSKCRKLISGLHYIQDDIKAEYLKKGLIPMFLSNKMFSRDL